MLATKQNVLSTIFTMVLLTMGSVAHAQSSWSFCANENAACSFSGTKSVRYGANGNFVTKSFTGGVGCHNGMFGDPAPGVQKKCEIASVAAATPVPTPVPSQSGWTFCANENATCTFSGTQSVRYGGNGSFVTKTFTGSVGCHNGMFGDPAPGVQKKCEVSGSVAVGTPAPTPVAATPVPTPVASGWSFCANENATCSFSGTQSVRYGANGSYVTKTFTGSVGCHNGSFGDPAPGYQKKCEVNGSVAAATPVPTPVAGVGRDIDLTGYRLTFSDEFNAVSVAGSSPKNEKTWFYLPPYGAAGFYSDSIWDANAFSVENGILKNKATWDASVGRWRSGNISSMDEHGRGFSQQYGYFMARAKMPRSGSGAWPAFWLLPQNNIPMLNIKQQGIEIDIFEWYGIAYTNNEALMQQATHNWRLDGSQDENAPFLYRPQTPMPGGAKPWEDFHNYGCLITPQFITFYIDGVQTNRIATPTAYMTSAFYIMLDYAVGGGWPTSGMVNGSSFDVDYVRVYALPQ
jgi:beta-glucanase (GH16 family)